MDNYTALEQLSHIYHAYNGLPKAEALMCIHNTIGLIFDSGTIVPSGEMPVTESALTTAIIEKYSDYYQNIRAEGAKVERSFLKLYQLDQLDKTKALSIENFNDITDVKLSEECVNNSGIGCDQPIPIDVMHSGFNFECKLYSGVPLFGRYIPNATLDLSAGRTYLFNIDSSGHPFAIQTVAEPYNSGSLVPLSNNPTATGTIELEIPKSGLWINNQQYKTLYYACANDGDKLHFDNYENINFTIIGTNDVPIITDIKDNFIGVAEEVDATGQIILANGKVRLLDLDFEDTLTYTITPLTFFGQLTSPDRFSIELEADPSGDLLTNAGYVDMVWKYSGIPTNLDFLRFGQTIPLRWNLKFNDGHQNSNTVPISIYLYGTNDPVILNTGLDSVMSGTVTALPNYSTDILSTEGYFYFQDPDLGDVHRTYYEKISGNHGVLGLSLDEANKKVTWIYDVSNVELWTLSSGMVVEEVFRIYVADNYGSSFSEDISISLSGVDQLGTQSIDYDISQYTTFNCNPSGTGITLIETNFPFYKSGEFCLSGISINFDDKVSLTATVEISGRTSGLPVSSGQVLDMLSYNLDKENEKITWAFNSKPEAFNYLRLNDNLNISYQIRIAEDKEGGIINIKPPFQPYIVEPRYDAYLEPGTHDYIDSKYWGTNERIPLKYGGLSDIKVFFDRNTNCVDINNFKYLASGSLLLDNIRIPFHPQIISEDQDVFAGYKPSDLISQNGNWGWNNFLYTSELSELQKRKYILQIGKNYEDILKEYDEKGEVSPYLYSTKWPAEKVYVSFEPSFIGVSGIHYESGDPPLINVITDKGELLCSGEPVAYRNISLVDIRPNVYVVNTYLNSQLATNSTFVTKCSSPIIGYFLTADNQPFGSYFQLEYMVKNGQSAYTLSALSVLVQNREWHRDAGHALLSTSIEIDNDEIVDIIELSNAVETFGIISWAEGYDGAIRSDEDGLSTLGKITKVGSIRGTFATVCTCDENGDIADCGCTDFLFANQMYFPIGTDISDLEGGMQVYGPFVPYGTYITEINRSTASGGCGPVITISQYVDDEITGGVFGNCSRYYSFYFSKLETTKKIDIVYPLRSNKAQLFEYGLRFGQIYMPVFCSYAYYHKWVGVPVGPYKGVIKIAGKSPTLYPSQNFSSTTGDTRSSWDMGYRPVSLSAYESKMTQPGSLINETYSDLRCKGTFPFFDIQGYPCPSIFCPTSLDPCFVCIAFDAYGVGGNGGRSFNNPCYAQDILAYDGTSFFNYDINPNGIFLWEGEGGIRRYDPLQDLDYLIANSGTGWAGNADFPAGTVQDPLHRPIIDGHTGAAGVANGYINPSVEVTRNPQKDPRPMSLDTAVYPIVYGEVADTPFYVYQPHGHVHFLVIYRRRLGWGEPKYAFDQCGNETPDTLIYTEPDPIGNPGIFLPYPEYSCAPGYATFRGKNTATVRVFMDNLHVNVVKDIHGQYPEKDQNIIIDNHSNFDTGIILPSESGTGWTLTTPLYNPWENAEYDRLYPCTDRRVYVREETFHGNVNVGNEDNPWYCYQLPEKVKTCGDTNSVISETSALELIDFGYTLEGMEQLLEQKYQCCRPYTRGCFCPLGERFDRFGFSTFPLVAGSPLLQSAVQESEQLWNNQECFSSVFEWEAVLDFSQYGCPCLNDTITINRFTGVGSPNFLGDPIQVFPHPTGLLQDCCQYPSDVPCPVFNRGLFTGGSYFWNNVTAFVYLQYYWDTEDKFPGNDMWARFVVDINFDNKESYSPDSYEYEQWQETPECFCDNVTPGDTSYEAFLKCTLCCENPENCLNIPATQTVSSEWAKIKCGEAGSFSVAGDMVSGYFTFKGDCIQSVVLSESGPLTSSDDNCGLGIPIIWG
jgi:VCBS repeat-containing protein